jgi:GH35 family endo-1,4-beta-xylanase
VPIDTSTLGGAALSTGRRLGTAVNSGALTDDPDYLELLITEFGSVTPENATKWGLIEPTEGTREFEVADTIVTLARDHSMRVKGHTLLWHEQLPEWIYGGMTTMDLEAAIDAHFEATLTHFGTDIADWDVVNEALLHDGSMRDTIFLDALGPDYLASAFSLAASYAPEARLFYNDYGIAGVNDKSDAMLEILDTLIEAGVPIHGVGLQMHLTHGSVPERAELEYNMNRLADLGLVVHISEMDVQIRHLQGPDTERLLAQAMTYYDVTAACVQVAGCEQLSFWGFTDRYSWIDDAYGADDPLLYDDDLVAKPAREAVHEALLGLPMTGCEESRLHNGDFESGTDGWHTWGSTLSTVTDPVYSGSSASLSTDRTSYWQGPVQSVIDSIGNGLFYEGRAWVRLANAESAGMLMTLQWVDDAGEHWSTVATVTANDEEWTEISGLVDFGVERTTGTITQANLYLEGPDAGVDFYADAVTLQPVCPDTAVPISR